MSHSVEQHQDDNRHQKADHDVAVVIHVNDKPVLLHERRLTGMDIKQAAITQGVPIQANFVLMKDLGGGRTEVVGDHDKVTVNKESRFVAVHADDNS